MATRYPIDIPGLNSVEAMAGRRPDLLNSPAAMAERRAMLNPSGAPRTFPVNVPGLNSPEAMAGRRAPRTFPVNTPGLNSVDAMAERRALLGASGGSRRSPVNLQGPQSYAPPQGGPRPFARPTVGLQGPQSYAPPQGGPGPFARPTGVPPQGPRPAPVGNGRRGVPNPSAGGRRAVRSANAAARAERMGASRLGRFGLGVGKFVKGSAPVQAALSINRMGEFADDGSDPYMQRDYLTRMMGGEGTQIEKASDELSGFWGGLGKAFKERGALGALGNLLDAPTEALAAGMHGVGNNLNRFFTGEGDAINMFAPENWILDKQGKIQYNPRGWAKPEETGPGALTKEQAERANIMQAMGQLDERNPDQRQGIMDALGPDGQMMLSRDRRDDMRNKGQSTYGMDMELFDATQMNNDPNDSRPSMGLKDGEAFIPGVGLVALGASGGNSKASIDLPNAIEYMRRMRGEGQPTEASGYESPEMQFQRHEARRMAEAQAGVPQGTQQVGQQGALGGGGIGGGSAGDRARAQALSEMSKIERQQYNTNRPGNTRDSGKLRAWHATNNRIEKRVQAADRAEREQLNRAATETVAMYDAMGQAARGSGSRQGALGPTSAQAGMANTFVRGIYDLIAADELTEEQIATKSGFPTAAAMRQYLRLYQQGQLPGAGQLPQ